MQNFREKLLSKYFLYLLCFLALNYIEFLRSTQKGNVWSAAANCTGLVMMVIIFSGLRIKEFLRPINYMYTVLCIGVIVAIYWYWRKHVGEYYFGQMATAVMNIWWIGLVGSYLFKQIFVRKSLCLKFGVSSLFWLAFTVWTVVSIAGRWWPLWYFLIFGAFYIIHYTQKDWQALVNAMIDGTILFFLIIQGWAFLFRPYDEVRYKGAFTNCNMMALYYLIVYCMVLFKLHIMQMDGRKKIWKVCYFVLAGVLLSLQFMTLCRTGWVTSVIITLAYGWFVVHKNWKMRIRHSVLIGGILILCTIAVFPAVYGAARWLPTVHPHPVWFEGEWNEGKVHSWDSADSEKYVSIDELMEAAFSRIYYTLRGISKNDPLALHVSAKEEEQFAYTEFPGVSGSVEGRLNIYKIYLEQSTWYGHPEEDGHYIILYGESPIMIWHAQNLFVQIIYYFGYPAGVLLFMLLLCRFLSGYKIMVDRRLPAYSIMPFMSVLLFFLFGLMEVVWNPGQLILALVFFMQHPQFGTTCGWNISKVVGEKDDGGRKKETEIP